MILEIDSLLSPLSMRVREFRIVSGICLIGRTKTLVGQAIAAAVAESSLSPFTGNAIPVDED